MAQVMNKLLAAIACCLIAISAVYAQRNSNLLASIPVENASSIAVGKNGDVIFIGTNRGATLSIYDFSSRDTLNMLNEVALDGALVDMTVVDDYALALLEVDGDGDQIVTVGPDPYRDGEYGVLGAVDVPDGPRQVFAAPDHRWALVVGDGWSMVLQLVSSVESIAYAIEIDGNPSSGAAAVGMALVGTESPDQIQQFLLQNDRAPRASRSLALDGPPVSLSLNARMSLGAAAVANSVVLFDPAVMETVGNSLEIEETPTSAQFLTREDGEWLVVAVENSSDLLLYEATDPTTLSAIGSLPLDMNPRKFILYDDLVFATDGRQVSVFQLN